MQQQIEESADIIIPPIITAHQSSVNPEKNVFFASVSFSFFSNAAGRFTSSVVFR